MMLPLGLKPKNQLIQKGADETHLNGAAKQCYCWWPSTSRLQAYFRATDLVAPMVVTVQ